MTPSELADNLEASDWIEYRNRAEEHREKILKSLHFAADMERLCSQGRCPLFCTKGDDPMVQLSLYDFGERVHFYAEDIYSAARKAVEALKGKE